MSDRLAIVVLMAVNGGGLWILERLVPRSPGPDARRRVGANLALTSLLVALNLAGGLAATAVGLARPDTGLLRAADLPAWTDAVAVVVVLDGLAYAAHVLMHKLPVAWRFHRVHHSDAHVDVTTAFRQHPLETAWRYSFQLAGAWALGASSGAVALYLALSALNAQLEHADVAWPSRLERLLRFLIATPAMHRVHHSRAQAETDSNYSNILSVWDRLFRTYRPPRSGERIAFGLEGCDTPERQRTVGLLALPFRR